LKVSFQSPNHGILKQSILTSWIAAGNQAGKQGENVAQEEIEAVGGLEVVLGQELEGIIIIAPFQGNEFKQNRKLAGKWAAGKIA